MWIGRFNLVNMSVFPKLIYRFDAFPIKIPAGYFVDIDKCSKSYMERHKK